MDDKNAPKIAIRKRFPYDEKKGTPVTWFTQFAKILQEMLTECGLNEILATRLSTCKEIPELYIARFAHEQTPDELARFDIPVSGIPLSGFDKLVDIAKQPLEIRLRAEVVEILEKRARTQLDGGVLKFSIGWPRVFNQIETKK